MTDLRQIASFAEPKTEPDIGADIEADTDQAFPPVHLWNPPNCGDIGMEIRHDGSWWHAGGEIKRQKIVKLFSRILRKDGDEIYLVTPYEKVIVKVESTPFLAVDFQIDKANTAEQTIIFETNLGEFTKIGAKNPFVFADEADTPYPYIEVRDGLLARISRPSYHRLMHVIADAPTQNDEFGLLSDGVFFKYPTA